MMEAYGGSAFPIPEDESNPREEGMTLRDYFAAKAMQALLPLWYEDIKNDARENGDHFDGLNLAGNEGGTPYGIADDAYAMADAMLNVREQTK